MGKFYIDFEHAIVWKIEIFNACCNCSKIVVLANHKLCIICLMIIYSEINDNVEVFKEHLEVTMSQ